MAQDPRPTSIELGPYRLAERIGEGGSGKVYRAHGPTGLVAIKLLGPASDMDDAARARFGREIAALGQLAHPNLVTMIDHGIDAELGPYLVLPLLVGANLRVLCGGLALCPEAALLLIEPVVRATVALHAGGYVHRDLKPENVIAGFDGAVTVIDLGLAWRDGMTRHTDTGAAVGSVGYMAPEQIEGGVVDARADVWSLGVMIYEWIAGKRPFARTRPAEEAAAMLLGQCPRLTAADRRCDEQLADLVARCLSVDPARRPAAAELADALAAMIDWTDDPVTERAAVVADPVAYQARISAFRIRRLERIAREAIAAGHPFAALAACDRGLAYAPDHAQLLALVGEAEAATAKPRAASRTDVAPDHVPTSPGGQDPARAVAVHSAPSRWSRRRLWPWLAASGLGIVVGGATLYLVTPDAPNPDPWASRPSTSAPAPAPQIGMADGDRKLFGDFISVFGKAMTMVDRTPPAAGATPTTATGWLDLAATQAPADAVVSIRQALALSPSWIDAQIALCVTLGATHDPGALSACDVVLRQRPDERNALAARGLAHLDANNPAAALADFDRVVAADPDPRWRRMRARARTAAGDHAGAKRDLDHACQLGLAAACTEHR